MLITKFKSLKNITFQTFALSVQMANKGTNMVLILVIIIFCINKHLKLIIILELKLDRDILFFNLFTKFQTIIQIIFNFKLIYGS